MPAALVAAVATLPQVVGAEDEEARLGVAVSRRVGLEGGAVSGEDLGAARMTKVEARRMRLAQRPVGELIDAHRSDDMGGRRRRRSTAGGQSESWAVGRRSNNSFRIREGRHRLRYNSPVDASLDEGCASTRGNGIA